MRPLEGKKVLVTRPRGQAKSLVDKLEALGAQPLEMPAIELTFANQRQIYAAIGNLDSFDWIVFTSVNGVAALSRYSELKSGVVSRKLAAIGPATAKALEEAYRSPEVMPSQFISDAIADAMGDVRGKRILLPRADIARKELADDLRRGGADVVEAAVYRIIQAQGTTLWTLDNPDFITVTSSAGAKGTCKNLEDGGVDWFYTVPIICIGPVTAATVKELGVEPAAVGKTYTIDGLVAALVDLAEMAHA